MIIEGCNNLHERDLLVPGENLTLTQNLALNRGSLLTPVHRHSQPPDEGETSVNVHSKAKLEDTSNAPSVSLQVKTKSSLLLQYKKSFVVNQGMRMVNTSKMQVKN